jgi:hypothetical protein
MQFYIWYQQKLELDDLHFRKYWNDSSIWKTLKALQKDNHSLTVITMTEV